MYTKILIPLDGSNAAEDVLPYARAIAGKLGAAVELLEVIDVPAIASHIPAARAAHIDTAIENYVSRSKEYLERVAKTFARVDVSCTVAKGRAEEVIIGKAEADRATLIAMATHGRSGLDRWLLGSVAEKVLRGTANPLLLIRASEHARNSGEAALKSVVVPLDGSELAETILPVIGVLAGKLDLAVTLFRAYNVPYSVYAGGEGYYAMDLEAFTAELKEQAREYLESKVAELKKLGGEKVAAVAREGFSADQIIKIGGEAPDGFIAMCSHGRSGAKRWVLGSVAETVVRHTSQPVLIVRPGIGEQAK